MSILLTREIDRLKRTILSLGALVEENVHKAIKAFREGDVDLAAQVAATDKEIDRIEIEVEEECLKILALHQPVAIDLRFIIVVLKMNHDLERIGDLAVNIAEEAPLMTEQAGLVTEGGLPAMAEKTRVMLKKSLDALVNLDASLARDVWMSDDEVDAIHEAIYERLRSGIHSAPDRATVLMHTFNVSRNLERMADHATNIAKDIIYMVEGEIVRHRGKEAKNAGAAKRG